MQNILSALFALVLSTALSAQNTLIPDKNFEQALINLGYDAVIDGLVTTKNINTLSNLDVSNKSIGDLSGIEDFTSLTTLYCNDNDLNRIDLSSLDSLKDIRCYNNQLNTLILNITTI